MKNLKILFIILLIPTWISAQTDVYLFAYFTQNGQDGLHFAYSYGLKMGFFEQWQIVSDPLSRKG